MLDITKKSCRISKPPVEEELRGALLIRNYSRDVVLQMHQEERSQSQIEELNSAKRIQKIMQLVTE